MSDHHEEPKPAAPVQPPPENEITFFAKTNFRNENRRFGIKIDDRRRHMYVIGKTGMGKSTLLENMIIQDIQNGKGVAVVDPHGDLVEKVVNFIPKSRINDVVYFNPSDVDHPIAFNILENVDPSLKNLVSNGLVGVFKKIWADSWGPRLEYILINAILALLEYPGSTLLGVTRMLVDAKYRKKVVGNITDPVVKSFWVDEYNNYTEKFRSEAIAPIQNKVGQFLSSSLIRNIVGQSKSTIDMRQLMDEGKIVLMNLSKGRIGEENAALLGAMMITKIQLAAMSRVDIPEPTRRDFYLYVDEFQNFSTESFANILSEARKYRLNLIMAHQYIEQLSDEVKAAVFGNVGTLIAFRVGATDAEELEKEFQPTFMQEDIVTLPAHHVYLRLMIDGVASEPFSASTLPPISGQTDEREKVIAVSRERYARGRETVEEKIRKWAGYGQADGGEAGEDEDEPEEALQRTDAPKKRFDDAKGGDRRGAPKNDRRDGGRDGGRDSGRDGGRDRKPADRGGKPEQRTSQPAPKDVKKPVEKKKPEEADEEKPAAPVTPAPEKKSPQPPAILSVPKPSYFVPQAAPVEPAPVARPQPVQQPQAKPAQPRPQPAPQQPVQPVTVQPTEDWEDLRSKKLSFVAPVETPKQPQPQQRAQPRPQPVQPEAPSTVEFHSLAEALPGDLFARPPAQPERRSQEPRKQQGAQPQQPRPQPAQQPRPQPPAQPRPQPASDNVSTESVGENSDAVAADGTKKKRRRRRRKKGNGTTPAESVTVNQPVPAPLQPPTPPRPTAPLPQAQPLPRQPQPQAQPRPQPLPPQHSTQAQPIQPGQAIHFD